MEQEQQTYLILGRGNLSRHLQHYFRLLKQPFEVWHRGLDTPLSTFSLTPRAVLMSVSDDAIAKVRDQLSPQLRQAPLIHFSGARVVEGIHGYHPLTTLASTLYDLETYQAIPFICEKDAPAFSTLFPMFQNPHFLISKNLKPLYHAWCSLAGNMSTFLWESAMGEFKTKLNLPAEALIPFLKQSTRNIELAAARRGVSALTGPLARGDSETVALHLKTLQQTLSPGAGIYEAFVDAYEKTGGAS